TVARPLQGNRWDGGHSWPPSLLSVYPSAAYPSAASSAGDAPEGVDLRRVLRAGVEGLVGRDRRRLADEIGLARQLEAVAEELEGPQRHREARHAQTAILQHAGGGHHRVEDVVGLGVDDQIGDNADDLV